MSAINIYYQNVRGLRTKTNNLLRNVCVNNYDIIVFTETWLTDDIYDIYLCNENKGNSYNVQLNNFANSLNRIMFTNPLDKFIILGDFNFSNNVDWISVSTNSLELTPINISSQHIKDFFDTATITNLSQYNNIKNANDRLLDLVFSNDSVGVAECTDPLALPVDLHHKPLIINANFIEIHKLVDKKITKFIYSKGNYEAIRADLDQVKWDELLLTKPLNEAVTIFYSKLYELRDKYIPIKTITHSSHPPWYNSALVKMLKEKYKYHCRYKTYRNISDYHSFSILRSRVIELEKSCFNTYMEKVESTIIKNPKSFWSYIKSKKNTNSFPNVMRYGDETASTGEGISNLFATFFRSTYQEPDPLTLLPSDCCVVDSSTCISTVEISYPEVLRRQINDICFLLNIANGTVDCSDLLANLALKTNLLGFRQRPLLYTPFTTTKYRRNAFLSRAARSFNVIPHNLNIDLFCTSAATARRLLAKSFFED
uniref:SFRICE_006870 n=1 Tax=Spodoptera frugiperda TaxID=7108 RepID=A0A2H1VAL0_SPOFR